jgi:crotonobetaine/carnitine-CoA ligase
VGPQWSGADAATIVELVRRACVRFPSAPAMIFEDGLVVKYSHLLERVQQFAGYLRSRIHREERVAIILGNRAEFMIAWLATVAVRGTVVSINPASKSHDAGHALQDSESVMVITDDEHRDLVGRLRNQCPTLRDELYVSGSEPDGLSAYCAGVTPLPLSESRAERRDIVNIYYTSGTTGPPKGCMVDHEWWLRTVDVLLRRIPTGHEDRQLCCLQFFYSDPGHQLLECLQTGGHSSSCGGSASPGSGMSYATMG